MGAGTGIAKGLQHRVRTRLIGVRDPDAAPESEGSATGFPATDRWLTADRRTVSPAQKWWAVQDSNR
jgi:hypothetical protein